MQITIFWWYGCSYCFIIGEFRLWKCCGRWYLLRTWVWSSWFCGCSGIEIVLLFFIDTKILVVKKISQLLAGPFVISVFMLLRFNFVQQILLICCNLCSLRISSFMTWWLWCVYDANSQPVFVTCVMATWSSFLYLALMKSTSLLTKLHFILPEWYSAYSWQGNPIVGVHIFLYSADVVDVYCPQGPGNGPGQGTALCHAISDAEGKFVFKSLPCGNFIVWWIWFIYLYWFSLIGLEMLSFCRQ